MSKTSSFADTVASQRPVFRAVVSWFPVASRTDTTAVRGEPWYVPVASPARSLLPPCVLKRLRYAFETMFIVHCNAGQPCVCLTRLTGR